MKEWTNEQFTIALNICGKNEEMLLKDKEMFQSNGISQQEEMLQRFKEIDHRDEEEEVTEKDNECP